METSGWVEWPDYRIDVQRIRNRVRVSVGDRLVADSTSALLVAEQNHGIVLYLPRADVRVEDLVATDDASRCPFKGQANYWRLTDATEPVAWEYREPYPEVEILRDHLGFYQDRAAVEIGEAHPAVSGFRAH